LGASFTADGGAGFASLYFADSATDGEENLQATYVGSRGLATNSGAAVNTLMTSATNATFSIQVDGGIAVVVSVGSEIVPLATLGNGLIAQLDAYTAKVETAINAQLIADGQTGRVTVGYDAGYRLTITSNEEGSDSAVRLSVVDAEGLGIGLASNTVGAISDNGFVGADGVENASETYEGSLTLRSVNGDTVNITAGSGSLESSGLQSGEFVAGAAFASSQSQSVSGAVATQGSLIGERISTGGLDDNLISGIAAALTIAFSIEVDGGNLVAVTYTQATATSTDFASLANYLTGLESQINAALATDGQGGSVTVTTNADNQLIIESNAKGTTSSIEISVLVTAGGFDEETTVLGLTNNSNAFGSSGATSTQGVLTSVGAIEGSSLGQVFSTALLGLAGTILTETIRISVDGGETIDAFIATSTSSDAVAALAFVESEINEELAASGQSGRISIALNTEGFVTITSDKLGDGSSVEILSNNTATQTFSNIAGLQDYQKSATALTTVSTPNGLDSGDLVLNGVAIETAKAADDTASNTAALSSSKQASGIATAAAINRVSDQTGIQATVNTTSLSGGAQTATLPADTPQSGSIFINGVETSTITTNGANGGADDRAAAISAINAVTGQTGVTAVDDGKGITLEATDGRNISVVINNNDKAAKESGGTLAALTGAAIGLNVAEADITGGATFAATAQTTYSTVTLDGPGIIDVQAGANGAAALEELGFRVGEYGSSVAGTRLSDLDITTVAGAALAIKALDNAIGSVASQRADLGAIQNRLDSTVNNLSLTSINLAAANSRIQDADFAAETAELSRSQVLQQAGISILAQANALPQQVLSLLG
jgi:flagellin